MLAEQNKPDPDKQKRDLPAPAARAGSPVLATMTSRTAVGGTSDSGDALTSNRLNALPEEEPTSSETSRFTEALVCLSIAALAAGGLGELDELLPLDVAGVGHEDLLELRAPARGFRRHRAEQSRGRGELVHCLLYTSPSPRD